MTVAGTGAGTGVRALGGADGELETGSTTTLISLSTRAGKVIFKYRSMPFLRFVSAFFTEGPNLASETGAGRSDAPGGNRYIYCVSRSPGDVNNNMIFPATSPVQTTLGLSGNSPWMGFEKNSCRGLVASLEAFRRVSVVLKAKPGKEGNLSGLSRPPGRFRPVGLFPGCSRRPGHRNSYI